MLSAAPHRRRLILGWLLNSAQRPPEFRFRYTCSSCFWRRLGKKKLPFWISSYGVSRPEYSWPERTSLKMQLLHRVFHGLIGNNLVSLALKKQSFPCGRGFQPKGADIPKVYFAGIQIFGGEPNIHFWIIRKCRSGLLSGTMRDPENPFPGKSNVEKQISRADRHTHQPENKSALVTVFARASRPGSA